jgi:TetR/AcrR family transcriptional regulator, transcriptional repressor for nem operon
MARSQAEKEATHRRIVKAAAAQIRQDGVAAVRVSELMREAGLTHGGFYRHFGSREDLVEEAIDAARSPTDRDKPILGQAWTPEPSSHRSSTAT